MNNYLTQCRDLNAIIGGNGRKGFNNKTKRFKKPLEVGVRPTELLVDYVGHLWCIKPEHIRTMASLKPYTFDTGEDMHLCYSNKIIGNVKVTPRNKRRLKIVAILILINIQGMSLLLIKQQIEI